MRISKQGGSGLRDGQDEGRETEMIQVCEEDMCRCLSEEVREVGYSRYGDRYRQVEKVLERSDQIRLDATSTYREHDFRVWTLRIRVEGQQLMKFCFSAGLGLVVSVIVLALFLQFLAFDIFYHVGYCTILLLKLFLF